MDMLEGFWEWVEKNCWPLHFDFCEGWRHRPIDCDVCSEHLNRLKDDHLREKLRGVAKAGPAQCSFFRGTAQCSGNEGHEGDHRFRRM